jgi:glycosyltransferase involved in cell wall biosynthesis
VVYVKRSNDQPLVSVIIPTRNSEATIEKCLKSLMEQSYKNLEIIVVDNHSDDRTREIAKKYDAKIYLKGPERSAQVNFGAQKSRGKYIYRVDSDFVLQPDVIQEAVESCERYGCDAIVIHNTSDPTVSFWARVRKAERDCYRNDELNVAARFWKREVFESIGGFDQTIVAGDDYDLHGRLVKNGFKIGRIKAEEVHVGEPKTLADVVQKHYYYGKNIESFVRKDPGKALRQLNPLRESHIKGLRSSFSDPILIAGFIVYQFVRYTSAAMGILARALFERS